MIDLNALPRLLNQIAVAFLLVSLANVVHAMSPECQESKLQGYGTTHINWDFLKPSAVIVKNRSELLDALQQASATTQIALEPGEYDLGVVDIDVQVELVGVKRGAATIGGTSVIRVNAAGTAIRGLTFRDGGPVGPGLSRDSSIVVTADHVEITHNRFKSIGIGSTVPDGAGIAISIYQATSVLIEENEFSRMHGLAIKTFDLSPKLIVANNDFFDSPFYGGPGEVVQIGDALSVDQGIAPREDRSFSLFRGNFVCSWNLEPELIYIKSDQNLIEDNLIVGSAESAIVVRMGNENVIRRNILLDNEGYPIRISGERNRVEHNFFQGSGAAVFLHREIEPKKLDVEFQRFYWAAVDNVIRGNVFSGYSRLYDDTGDDFYFFALSIEMGQELPRTLSYPSGNLFEENTFIAGQYGFQFNLEEYSGETGLKRNMVVPRVASELDVQ